MKKRLSAIAVSAFLALSVTGCGIVTIVPIGEEAKYTGVEEFDSSAESSNDWSQVVEEIKNTAADFSEAVKDGGAKEAVAVKGTAKIVEFNTDTPKYYLLVEVDGYDGTEEIKIQAGGVYSGTTVRDVQTLKGFEDFTNQTEWSQYAKALNKEVDAQVVVPLALDENAAGKTVTFSGAAIASGDTVTITPVELTIE